MNASSYLRGAAVLFPLLWITACNTTTSQQNRIVEQQAEFAALSPSLQSSVSKGIIEQGYTLAMVYMALGRPDTIEALVDGRHVQWGYRNFYPSAAVSEVPLYRVPKIDPLQRSVQKWKAASQRSVNDDMVGNLEYRTATDMPDPTGADPDLPGVTLAVSFVDGGVTDFTINGEAQ
ncbi:MAG: hypothetical protein IT582_08940 [Opitutaceae bacterium]|nr:hypothetical protein [Opitutaceae bacterium]